MVQTGDPTNTGKGGQSIWGQPFADEFVPDLKVSLFIKTNNNHFYFIFLKIM